MFISIPKGKMVFSWFKSNKNQNSNLNSDETLEDRIKKQSFEKSKKRLLKRLENIGVIVHNDNDEIFQRVLKYHSESIEKEKLGEFNPYENFSKHFEEYKKSKFFDFIDENLKETKMLTELLGKYTRLQKQLKIFNTPYEKISENSLEKIQQYHNLTKRKVSDTFEILDNDSIFYNFVRENKNKELNVEQIINQFESEVKNLPLELENKIKLENNTNYDNLGTRKNKNNIKEQILKESPKYYDPKNKKEFKEKVQEEINEEFESAKKYIKENNIEDGFIILEPWEAKTSRKKKDGSYVKKKYDGKIIKLKKRKFKKESAIKAMYLSQSNGTSGNLSYCKSPKEINEMINIGYKLSKTNQPYHLY